MKIFKLIFAALLAFTFFSGSAFAKGNKSGSRSGKRYGKNKQTVTTPSYTVQQPGYTIQQPTYTQKGTFKRGYTWTKSNRRWNKHNRRWIKRNHYRNYKQYRVYQPRVIKVYRPYPKSYYQGYYKGYRPIVIKKRFRGKRYKRPFLIRGRVMNTWFYVR